MSPLVALSLWFILLIGLLYLDPAKTRRTSLALWIPVIWIFIVGTRLPSQWFGGKLEMASQGLEEGNSFDRIVYCIFILLAIGILASRSFKWGDFFTRNLALTAFIVFALVSMLWSDFPFVSFKRWFRDLGNYLVVLVALSDPFPFEAVRTLLRRLCYLLIPLSILIIRYYPGIGMEYNSWTGTAMYVGPTTSKNSLGVVCLVCGIFFFWDTVTRWPDRRGRKTRWILLLNVAFIAMTLWILKHANSATSSASLAIGCLIILAAHSKILQRRPALLKTMIPLCLCLYPIMAFGFDMKAELAGAVGRDPTFTERTAIWKILPAMQNNPLVGTGYESFWLGPRLKAIWQSPVGGINEAHNGYLEVYLNLGIVGLFLLSAFLIASYRLICKRLTPFTSFASLSLALWAVAVLYNVTEAAFKFHLIWVVVLVVAISVPVPKQVRARRNALCDETIVTEQLVDRPLEVSRRARAVVERVGIGVRRICVGCA
jgi:exopolysaccharide production protein ExoQ